MRDMAASRFSQVATHAMEQIGGLLHRLHGLLPFQLWMVTRTQGESWIVLHALDHGYGVLAGDTYLWEDSFCSRMVKGLGPCIAPDAQSLPVYQKAPISKKLPIGAYVGVPLLREDHNLFGTLCAIDPGVQPENIAELLPVIQDFASAISGLIRLAELDTRTQRAQAADQLLEWRDPLGMLAPQALFDFVRSEEVRSQAIGAFSGVIHLQVEPEGDAAETDAGWDIEVRLPLELKKWGEHRDCMISRLSSLQYLLLMPDCDRVHLNLQTAELRRVLEPLRMQIQLTYGVRDMRNGFEQTIRNCMNPRPGNQAITEMRISAPPSALH